MGESDLQKTPAVAKSLFNRGGVVIETDDQELVAYLSFTPSQKTPVLKEATLRAVLKEAHIEYGIDDDAVREVCSGGRTLKRFVIARGKEAVEGKPSRLDYKFPTNPWGAVGVESEDGRINFREKGELPYVKAGDELATVIPGTDPVIGKKVTGGEIQASLQLATGIEPGARVEVVGDRYLATVDGGPRLDDHGRIEVVEVWVVDRDVDIHTGNIRFKGPVKIKGLVNSGFEVEAKSVECDGIEKKAIVKAQENVMVDGGILGGVVRAGGEVSARFFNSANVTAVGNIEVKLSIINSEVNSAATVKAQTVIGGTVASLLGLECVNLSSEASRATVIFGIDPIKEQQMKDLVAKKVDIEGKIALLEEELAPLYTAREEAEKIKREVQNLLAEQTALQQRRAKVPDGDASAIEFFDSRISELEKQIEPLKDRALEIKRGMSEFEGMAEKEVELKKLRGQLAALDEHQKTILSSIEEQETPPAVVVKGAVLRGTRFSGAHAQLVTRQDYRRVRFRELKSTESKEEIKPGAKPRTRWIIKPERL